MGGANQTQFSARGESSFSRTCRGRIFSWLVGCQILGCVPDSGREAACRLHQGLLLARQMHARNTEEGGCVCVCVCGGLPEEPIACVSATRRLHLAGGTSTRLCPPPVRVNWGPLLTAPDSRQALPGRCRGRLSGDPERCDAVTSIRSSGSTWSCCLDDSPPGSPLPGQVHRRWCLPSKGASAPGALAPCLPAKGVASSLRDALPASSLIAWRTEKVCRQTNFSEGRVLC